MRKRTLALCCSIAAIGILIAVSLLEFRVPFGLAPLIVFLVFVPLLMVLLGPVNKRLLAWRKKRGRDIEEEALYEREGAGIISIRPKSQAEIEEDEQRYRHPMFR